MNNHYEMLALWAEENENEIITKFDASKVQVSRLAVHSAEKQNIYEFSSYRLDF